MGDLHDRLTYLEERLKALDKFDAPLGMSSAVSGSRYVRTSSTASGPDVACRSAQRPQPHAVSRRLPG
eukprot:1511445-Rhodomonas_salina.4